MHLTPTCGPRCAVGSFYNGSQWPQLPGVQAFVNPSPQVRAGLASNAEEANFSLKGQVVNIFGFVGHMVAFPITQLRGCSYETSCVPIRLNLQKWMAGTYGLWPCLLTPVLTNQKWWYITSETMLHKDSGFRPVYPLLLFHLLGCHFLS